jgi:hypothetical protein
MLAVIKSAPEDSVKAQFCEKLVDIAERFAPSEAFFVDTVVEMLQAAGDAAPATITHSFTDLLETAEDTGIQQTAADTFIAMLRQTRKMSDIQLQVCLAHQCF